MKIINAFSTGSTTLKTVLKSYEGLNLPFNRGKEEAGGDDGDGDGDDDDDDDDE